MSDKVVLGIHSHVDPNTQGSFNQFVDGHAWISVTRNGQTTIRALRTMAHVRTSAKAWKPDPHLRPHAFTN